MPNPNRTSKPDIEKSEQELFNKSFDPEFDVLAVENLVYNPATGALDRDSGGDPNYATRIDDTATPIIYIGKASIGASPASAVWQIAKLDTSSGLIKTWAGSAGFTQIWDNRTSLTYN